MIRIATLEDYDVLKSMILKFMNESVFKDHLDEEVISSLLTRILKANPLEHMTLINTENKGFITGFISPSLFSKDLHATELAWWVEPKFRKTEVGSELLDGFEYWAKNIAHASLISVSTDSEKLGKLYEKKGYTLRERAYMKIV